MREDYLPPLTQYEAAQWPSEEHHIVDFVREGTCNFCHQAMNVAVILYVPNGGITDRLYDEVSICKYCATVIAMVVDRFEKEEAV